MTSDENLMLQFQNGSQEAFEELFQRYRRPLHGFFARRLRDPARAEELTQEVFIAVIEGQLRYEPRALVRTYFYGIGLNLVSAERRKQARRESTETGSEGTRGSPLDAAIWVRSALEQLEKIDREVIMLREYEELSYAEIATLLRLPVNTVRSRLFRARMALKELLTCK
jgi:RNA polymerase sigma-70 factor (ECF subfamily)